MNMMPFEISRKIVAQEAERLLGGPVVVNMAPGDEWVMMSIEWGGARVDASCPRSDFSLSLEEFVERALEPPIAILKAVAGHKLN